MIMVDQHPTNGLLGGTTKSLLDSSLDKFHEAVKFQEKKADLSFGPPNKIIPVDCSESIQIILNLITSKICGFGSKLDTENGMGCSTSQQISPKFDQIVVGDWSYDTICLCCFPICLSSSISNPNFMYMQRYYKGKKI
jgi:hypothetical protein